MPDSRRKTPAALLPVLVAGLATEVRKLRRTLDRELERRPTKAEVRARRRLSMFYLLMFVAGTVQVRDYAVSVCGPGDRAERIINQLVRGRIHSITDVQRIATSDSYFWCDVLFPVTAHNRSLTWPTTGDVIGGGTYLVLVVVGGAWVLRSYRDIDEDRIRAQYDASMEDVEQPPDEKERQEV